MLIIFSNLPNFFMLTSIFSGFELVPMQIIPYFVAFSSCPNKKGNKDPCGLFVPSLLEIRSTLSSKTTEGLFYRQASNIFFNLSSPSFEIKLPESIEKALNWYLFFSKDRMQLASNVLPELHGPHKRNPL